MKIKFLGAAGTVTGSSYVLTSGSGQSILIDLGMFQGTPDIEKLNYEHYESDPQQFLGMVLTHAHLDHCGRLPILLPKGFKEDVYMTAPTKDLTEIALLDAAKIAKEDSKSALYDEDLALQAISRFKTVKYHQTFSIGDFSIKMVDAGHILGSASLEIEDRNPNSEVRRLVFSGDLGNYPEPLEKSTEFFDAADAVVMESTYGDRLHPHLNAADAVQSEINTIEKTGGTLLIPAFSLERTQELLHMIKHLKLEGKVAPQTQIFLDGPMAQKATLVYLAYPEVLNDHIQSEMSSNNPFEFPGLVIVRGSQESRGIHEVPGPKVIIAGSGMMVGGRILGHAAHYLPIASTRLLIVGYQGDGTLGRALKDGVKKVTINDETISVQATISDTQALSSHADQGQLMNWLKHVQQTKKIFLTHGDNGPRAALALKITQDLGIKDVVLPAMNQEVQF